MSTFLSQLLEGMLQDALKERFAPFAYWLFYSEMILVLIGVAVVGRSVFMMLMGQVDPSLDFTSGCFLLWGLLAYAAFCFVSSRSYQRKRYKKASKEWRPGLFSTIACYFVQLSMSAMGAGLAWFELFVQQFQITNLLVAGVGFLLLFSGGYGGSKLLRGLWVDWP